MKPTPIYLVVLDDCHQDTLYWAFADSAKAIKFARREVKDHSGKWPLIDETEELGRRGMTGLHLWLSYRDGDHIEVREVNLS